jgi:hypothetical protein
MSRSPLEYLRHVLDETAYRRLRRLHDYLDPGGFPGHGENDLGVLDHQSPTPVHPGNFKAHVVYGLTAAPSAPSSAPAR